MSEKEALLVVLKVRLRAAGFSEADAIDFCLSLADKTAAEIKGILRRIQPLRR